MNEQSNKHDDQWLAALAGRPDLQANEGLNSEAGALRRALEVDRQRMESQVPAADEAQLQQLMFRLRREGLSGQVAAAAPNRLQQWAAKVGVLGLTSAADAITRKPAAWAAAASLVLVVAVIVQLQLATVHDRALDNYRGSEVTTLIVEQPEARLIELQAGLKGAGAVIVVERMDDGQIGLKVKATQGVLDFLATQRIEPLPKDGWIYIKIAKAK